LVELYKTGASVEDILTTEFKKEDETELFNPLFKM